LTSPVPLPAGDPENNYLLELVIRATDSLGVYTDLPMFVTVSNVELSWLIEEAATDERPVTLRGVKDNGSDVLDINLSDLHR